MVLGSKNRKIPNFAILGWQKIYNLALAGVCFAALMLTLSWAVGRYQSARKVQKSIFVVSSSYASFQDLSIVEETSKGLTSFKSYDEPGMRDMLRDLGVSENLIKAEHPVVLLPKEGQNAKVVTNEEEISGRLETAFNFSNNQRVPLLAVMALVGVALGMIIKLPRPWLILPLAVGALAMAYKINHACLVCPTTSIMGIPLEQLALCTYVGLLLIAPLAVTHQPLLTAIGVICLGALGVQLYLTSKGQSLCYPCICTALVNGIVVAQLTHPFTKIQEFRKAKRLFGLSAIGALGSFGYASIPTLAPISPQKEASSTGPKLGSGPQSLRGLTAKEIGIESKKGNRIVAIFSKECGACNDAKQYLAVHPWLPIQHYMLTSPGTAPAKPDEIRFQAGRLSSVPRFLYIKDDKIVSDMIGWSSDKAWQSSFDGRVGEFLNLSSDKEKQ